MPDDKPKPPRKRKMADIQADMGEAKRARFLQGVYDGLSFHDCLIAADWEDSGYRYHRRKHTAWAAKVDFATNAVKALDRAGLDPMETPSTFAEFVSKWFPDRRPHLPHQLQIADILGQLQPREIAMFLIWPEAGKSATLEDYICRKLAFDPTHRFRYVSEASNLSKRIVGTCKRRFTDASEYGPFIARYGPFYEKGQERQGRPWTTEEIMLANNPAKERDYNLVASSWTTATYGSRIDTLILDDLQSQNNINQAEDIFKIIRGTFFNRGRQMRTLIIGTRIGPGDFYERMLDAGLVTKQIILPAMDVDGNPKIPEFWDQDLMVAQGLERVVHNGGPCCKGFRTCPRDGSVMTPRETMEQMRFQSGEDTWWSSYMQQPRSDERSTFGAFVDRCLDRERTYGPLVPA